MSRLGPPYIVCIDTRNTYRYVYTYCEFVLQGAEETETINRILGRSNGQRRRGIRYYTLVLFCTAWSSSSILPRGFVLRLWKLRTSYTCKTTWFETRKKNLINKIKICVLKVFMCIINEWNIERRSINFTVWSIGSMLLWEDEQKCIMRVLHFYQRFNFFFGTSVYSVLNWRRFEDNAKQSRILRYASYPL